MQLSLREAANQLFDNRTWTSYEPENFVDAAMLDVWKGPMNNVLLTLFLFFAMRVRNEAHVIMD
jgi:chloride channel 2